MIDSGVRLYVKSVKTVTRAKKFETVTFATAHVGQGIVSPVTFDSEVEAKYEFVLSEDEQKVVEMVKEAASRYGLEVEIIDVARENIFHRAVQEEFENIKAFPTLVASSGEKIEGRMTKKQIESILSHVH